MQRQEIVCVHKKIHDIRNSGSNKILKHKFMGFLYHSIQHTTTPEEIIQSPFQYQDIRRQTCKQVYAKSF